MGSIYRNLLGIVWVMGLAFGSESSLASRLLGGCQSSPKACELPPPQLFGDPNHTNYSSDTDIDVLAKDLHFISVKTNKLFLRLKNTNWVKVDNPGLESTIDLNITSYLKEGSLFRYEPEVVQISKPWERSEKAMKRYVKDAFKQSFLPGTINSHEIEVTSGLFMLRFYNPHVVGPSHERHFDQGRVALEPKVQMVLSMTLPTAVTGNQVKWNPDTTIYHHRREGSGHSIDLEGKLNIHYVEQSGTFGFTPADHQEPMVNSNKVRVMAQQTFGIGEPAQGKLVLNNKRLFFVRFFQRTEFQKGTPQSDIIVASRNFLNQSLDAEMFRDRSRSYIHQNMDKFAKFVIDLDPTRSGAVLDKVIPLIEAEWLCGADLRRRLFEKI